MIVTRSSDLMELVNSEARVMLLYCTKGEAVDILSIAEELKLTGNYFLVSLFNTHKKLIYFHIAQNKVKTISGW